MAFDHANVIYYRLSVDATDNEKIHELILRLFGGEIEKGVYTSRTGQKYKINDEFHITLLFTGGKVDERAIEVSKYISTKSAIRVDKVGMSEDFICLGASICEEGIPYHGNETCHITVGLNTFRKGKRVFPKDSPIVLKSGTVAILDEPLVLGGVVDVVMKA